MKGLDEYLIDNEGIDGKVDDKYNSVQDEENYNLYYDEENDEYIDQPEDLYIEDDGEYYLTQSMYPNENNLYEYDVYDYNDVKVATWLSRHQVSMLSNDELKNSMIHSLFEREVKLAKDRHNKGVRNLSKLDQSSISSYFKPSVYRQTSFNDYLNDKSDWHSGYYYKAPGKTKGLAKDLKKSDTLVIHCQDHSTDMLSQIYEGKGWDVLRDGNIDKDELHELLECHDKIVMLGHGTRGGLINSQGGGYVIGDAEAPYLKDKKLFVIWCNADKYFNDHNLGTGQFITKNAPSEVWESRAAGCGNISSELMLENITYWSKLCADVVDECLAGNVDSGVDYIRKNYLEKYGNHPVTLFNADSAHALNKDKELPKYKFKGEHLTEKDFPIPNFDEEKFLENPTKEAYKCPKKEN